MDPIDPKIRALLDQIDDVLVKGDGPAQYLWDILSGLRGPDEEGCQKKWATTCVIRAAAFPKTAVESTYYGGPVLASMTADSTDQARYRTQMAKFPKHFNSHVVWAFCALGLKWDGVNDLPTASKAPSISTSI